ncbi:MAG: 2-C-methyl-D-erythritol 2,4-cyclodiphosphate synthase [Chlamydiales bacterium]|nr:2-C-methyl-D-erythritol 2,4-cyclodiphosphate synthase [Chlamydiales bacterium]
MTKQLLIRTGIGQDSHRFLPETSTKPCVIGGLIFEDVPGLQANSDGDIIFHALCNAISSVTGVIILGKRADELLAKEGITDSSVYLKEALSSLGKQQITHVAITLEGLRPKFLDRLDVLKKSIADVMQLSVSQVGITATTGEGLTDFGCGEGIQCICVLTTQEMS